MFSKARDSLAETKKRRSFKKIAIVAGIATIVLVAVLLLYAMLQIMMMIISQNVVTPHVEVDYKVVGWFYGSTNALSYNYTYLLLNVTIMNKGYSQVNPSSSGFEVSINNRNYQAYFVIPIGLYNGSTYPISFAYTESLPAGIKLRDGGNITGLIAFQFGDPSVIPQPQQIFNKTFTLEYSVTYGESFPYMPARVKIFEVP